MGRLGPDTGPFFLFLDAVELLAAWFREYPSWATGKASGAQLDTVAHAIDAVAQPTSGGLEELQDYADDICSAVADACGMDDFAGHGRYHVRAADRLGLSLTVSAE